MSTYNIYMPNAEYPGQYLLGSDAIDYNPRLSDFLDNGYYKKTGLTEAIYAMGNAVDMVITDSSLAYAADGTLAGGSISGLKLVADKSGKIMQSITGLTLSGKSFHDTVKVGSSYHTASVALNGNDTLVGSAGDDELWAYGGNDKIIGGAGDDNLARRRGKDTYDGGTGIDQIDYEDAYSDPSGAQFGYSNEKLILL